MSEIVTHLLAAASGGVVGTVLGLVGGGGSILAVPLLIYVVGISSPHMAIGTSAIAVSLSALATLPGHARARHVKWRCAAVFALSGVVGALTGSSLAKMMDGESLLALFGLLMLVVGAIMLRRRGGGGNPDVRLSAQTAGHLLPLLIPTGFTVGALSGFFGIGGGFLIVPGLMLATSMPLVYAIGTSLVAVAAFGAATAANYAVSGLIDWPTASLFIAGGFAGGIAGTFLGRHLAARKQVLGTVFALLVITVGGYVLFEALYPLVQPGSPNIAG